MKEYSVEEVANAINKSPETVRRLLRTKAIDAPKLQSNKKGWVITEEALRNFFENSPKYFTKAANTMLNSPTSLSIVMGGLITVIVAGAIKSRQKSVTSEQIKKYVEKEINEKRSVIFQDTKKIKKIESKIKELNKQSELLQEELEKTKEQLYDYNLAMREVDFDELANEINQKL